jgi:nucleotide-binding universal stress UspA family protein
MKIVLPVDGSSFSDAAVQAVIAQARSKDAEIRVLHVVEPPTLLATREMGGYDSALEKAWDAEKKQAQLLVEKTVELLRTEGLKAIGTVENGDAKSKILEVAKEWRADLIVLGSRGRKGLEHFLLGSVSEAVARHADCSVEIVRARAGHRKPNRSFAER